MPEVRRVRRVIRKIDTWTVLRLSACFYLIVLLVFIVAGSVLFVVASSTGLRTDVERFVGDLIASDNFRLLGGPILKAAVLGGLVLVVSGTAANVLLCLLYNLISDVIGGVEVSVLESEPPARAPSPSVTPRLPPASVGTAPEVRLGPPPEHL